MLNYEVGDDVGDGHLAGGGSEIVRDWSIGGDNRPGGGRGGCRDKRSANIIDIKTEQTSPSLSSFTKHTAYNGIKDSAAITNQRLNKMSASSAHLRM